MKFNSTEVAELLREFGRRAALAGANIYRARAYAKAADSLAALPVPLEEIIAARRLKELPGIGDSIAAIIEELHKTGSHPALEKAREDVPPGVIEMMSIPGLRPEKVSKLHRELGIASVEELEAAARADRLRSVKGFGPALQSKILEGIAIRRRSGGARHLNRAADTLALTERELLRSGLGLANVTPAGDFRRSCELVFDLAVVAQAPRVADGPQEHRNGDVAIYSTDAKRYGATLLLATGSEAHLSELSAVAGVQGLEINGNGLVRDGKVIASRTEAEIYDALGLAFIPPELREGRGEIGEAKAGKLPALVAQDDLRGILHAHTVASDGVNTLGEMADAARAKGYAYFGVSDHSQSAHYAGGLSIEEIERQHAEIDALNRAYKDGFRIFKGIESDILADGSLDYPDDFLDRFDFIVASIHGRFALDREAQTRRLMRAVANPHTTILGHMTGRQLLRREGYHVDIERVLAACAEHQVAVEINANPWRLDLDWRWHQRGLELGCMFSINPDAHSIAEIDLVRWGVGIARKGGVTAHRTLNALPLKEIEAHFAMRRRRRT